MTICEVFLQRGTSRAPERCRFLRRRKRLQFCCALAWWGLPHSAWAQTQDAAGTDACVQREPGCFQDDDERWKSAKAEYQRRQRALRPAHWVTLSEMTVMLAAGTLWYVVDRERNVADWDFPSWRQRFTLEAWKFDNNQFPINFIGHPIDGMVFYLFPRANDHNLWVSTGYAFATSFIWEFLIEFKEKVSVNDLIVTLGAGVTMGEFAHKVTRYFAGRAPDASTGRKVGSAVLGFPVWLGRAVRGRPQGEAGPYDRYGFSNHIGARLEAGYVYRQRDFGEIRNVSAFAGGGRLTSIPGEGMPGRFSLFFHDADITELWLSGGGGTNAREFELRSDSHLLGRYSQRLSNRAEGTSSVVALNLAYRYLFQDYQGYNNRLGLLRLPGLGVDLRANRGVLSVSGRARFNPDFGGLSAPDYGLWKGDLAPGEVEKTILRKHGYYYAWGYSTRLGASARAGNLELRVDAEFGRYDSQEGLDRNQEQVTFDVDLKDTLKQVDALASFYFPVLPMRFDLGWSKMVRSSSIGGLRGEHRLDTWSLGLSLLR